MTAAPESVPAASSGRLAPATKWLYGSADLGIGLLQATIGFYLMYFYTDIAGPTRRGAFRRCSHCTQP